MRTKSNTNMESVKKKEKYGELNKKKDVNYMRQNVRKMATDTR